MSGGHFDYQQYKIRDIADAIDEYVNGRRFYDKEDKEYYLKQLKHDIERYQTEYDKQQYEYAKDHDTTIPNEYEFGEDTIAEFRKAVKLLRKAEVYAQRIDWLLSGDDGEETFHERLKEDLEELED